MKANRFAGYQILHMPCVDSTNEEAKRQADNGAPHGSVFWADVQTAGKGRRGREWVSESAENLYFTLLLRPSLEPEKLSMLTLLMAYAVAQGLEAKTSLPPKIKWPNDLVLANKKVCGILSEMKLDGRRAAYCVIGVGINIGQKVFPLELQDKATSLVSEGVKTEPEDLLKAILEAFIGLYDTFMVSGDLSFIMDQYNEMLAGRNGMVRVLEPGGEYEGKSLGINSTGELLVEREDGTIQQVYAGEVSVRGLYGYV